MFYFATVNTGSPETGFLNAGDVLTDRQLEILGEEKLQELLAAGVLGVCRPDNSELGMRNSELEDGGAPDKTPAADLVDEESEELPTLELGDDIVGEEAAPTSETAPKRRSRSKGGKGA